MNRDSISPPPLDTGFTVLGEYTIGLYPDEDPYSNETTWLLPYFPTDVIWLVYALYRSHRDDRELAYPSAKQIALESGLCVRAVRQAISWLIEDGALQPVEPDEVRGPVRFYYPEADCRIRAGENILAYPACAGEPTITRAQLYFVNDFFQEEGKACPIPNWFLRDPEIPPGEKRLGALIAGLGEPCAFASFAKRLDVTPRTIARRVAFLRKEGKLESQGKGESRALFLLIPPEPPKRTRTDCDESDSPDAPSVGGERDLCQGSGAPDVRGRVHQMSPVAGPASATPSAGEQA